VHLSRLEVEKSKKLNAEECLGDKVKRLLRRK